MTIRSTKLALAGLILCGIRASANTPQSRPSIYIEPQDGFETYLAAAMAKKNVAVDIVDDKTKATHTLKPSAVDIKQESTGSKVTRCLFLYCAGIEDKGSVSVQLIEINSSKVVWAYAVNKQKGNKNEQSMAEAVAKHLGEFFKHLPEDARNWQQPSQQMNSAPVAQLAPIYPPAPPADPQIVKAGQSSEDVVAALGQPEKKAQLATSEIYFYKTLKVTFVDGKVQNVE